MRWIARVLGTSLLVSFTALAGSGCAGTPADGPDDSLDSDLTGSANRKLAFDFFVGKGLTQVQSAAIVGNLQQESGVNPSSVQPDGPGRGAAQWSVGARWDTTKNDNVVWFANKQGESTHSLDLQLAFIWYELENFDQYGLAALRRATGVGAAVYAFQKDFEVCGTCDASHRVSYANAVLKAYGGGS